MVTFTNVFRSILNDGFEGHREPLEACFDLEPGQGEETALVQDFSVRYVDGMQRGLAILLVLHYVVRLDRCRLSKSSHMNCMLIFLPRAGGQFSLHAA